MGFSKRAGSIAIRLAAVDRKAPQRAGRGGDERVGGQQPKRGPGAATVGAEHCNLLLRVEVCTGAGEAASIEG